KPVVRKATDADAKQHAENLAKCADAMKIAKDKIAKRNLDMKLVDVEYSFDGSKIVFSFTAESRVDFRDLVKDLASQFHARIELRQIGIRDECKLKGGLGPCGRPCCCNSCGGEFARVSIKMAKNQGLSLNPTKISGLCGRLMCCLKYEDEYYAETLRFMPKVGSEITTADGKAVVEDRDVLKQKIKARVTLKNGDVELREYDIKDITVSAKDKAKRGEEEPEEIPSDEVQKIEE
ncbi:MAG: stage 0 sporulation protein, partial [Corallococcus sp.]|nr:stage 0 sporulation protein [Corallococcus sp.]